MAYGEHDFRRLPQIVSYRSAGLTLHDIRANLCQANYDFTSILQGRLVAVGKGIERLRDHQRVIRRLLTGTHQLGKKTVISKEKRSG